MRARAADPATIAMLTRCMQRSRAAQPGLDLTDAERAQVRGLDASPATPVITQPSDAGLIGHDVLPPLGWEGTLDEALNVARGLTRAGELT